MQGQTVKRRYPVLASIEAHCEGCDWGHWQGHNHSRATYMAAHRHHRDTGHTVVLRRVIETTFTTSQEG